MSSRRIREATLTDTDDIVDLISEGFIEDEVYGEFMHPKRKEYPEDWRRFWKQQVRSHLIDVSSMNYVALDNESGKAVAWCNLLRIGDGAAERAANETPAQKAQRLMIEAEDKLEGQVWTDRTADPEAIKAFDENWNDIKHHFVGDRKEAWLIEIFCVHPAVQNKGYGRDLIQQAIKLCQSEQPPIPLSVISSNVGDAFYEKLGFREVGHANVGGLSGLTGGSLKFYERHLQS